MRYLQEANLKLQINSMHALSRAVFHPSFVGREAERLRLQQAIIARESVFISGPADIGKTALVLKVITDLEDLRCRCIYLSGVHGGRRMLEGILTRLFECRDETVVSAMKAARSFHQPLRFWLKQQSTSRLKGTLYRAAENGNFQIFLDHSTPMTRGAAKVLKELVLMCGTPVHLIAREKAEVTEGGEIYWSNQHRLSIPLLPHAAAAQLLEQCIQAHGLERFDLKNFRYEALSLSGSVPGALIGMCALAGEPRHHLGSKVKTRVVLIDYLTRGANSKLRRRGNATRLPSRSDSIEEI